MRILYDGSIYKLQRFGGVNRYFESLIHHLPDDIQPIVTTVDPETAKALNHTHPSIYYYHRFGLRPNRISQRLEPLYFNWAEWHSHADLLHPTFYFALSRRAWRDYRRPIVVTVYDLIHEIFQDDLTTSQDFIHVKRNLLEVASGIICISENTKQDLLTYYPQVAQKPIAVIPLATHLSLNLITKATPVISDLPYFIYVGGRWVYKNIDLLWQAIAQLRQQYPEVQLKMVGKPLTSAEETRLDQLGIRDRVEVVAVRDDATLADLYHHSLALVYPSRYEGFGLPPLEAMACGTVAIAANTASLPEVVGEAGRLFDPDSCEDLLIQMRWVMEHPQERQAVIEAGYQQAQYFSWQRMTDQTVAVYRSLL